MNKSLTPEERASQLLKHMKTSDKFKMIRGTFGTYVGNVAANKKLKIPALHLQDGSLHLLLSYTNSVNSFVFFFIIFLSFRTLRSRRFIEKGHCLSLRSDSRKPIYFTNNYTNLRFNSNKLNL